MCVHRQRMPPSTFTFIHNGNSTWKVTWTILIMNMANWMVEFNILLVAYVIPTLYCLELDISTISVAGHKLNVKRIYKISALVLRILNISNYWDLFYLFAYFLKYILLQHKVNIVLSFLTFLSIFIAKYKNPSGHTVLCTKALLLCINATRGERNRLQIMFGIILCKLL